MTFFPDYVKLVLEAHTTHCDLDREKCVSVSDLVNVIPFKCTEAQLLAVDTRIADLFEDGTVHLPYRELRVPTLENCLSIFNSLFVGEYVGYYDFYYEHFCTAFPSFNPEKAEGLGNEEGDICNRFGCDGVIKEHPRRSCSCHINPPCSACVEPRGFCDKCGWDSQG